MVGRAPAFALALGGLLLAVLSTPPLQVGVTTPPPLRQQAHRTLDLIYNTEFDAALRAAQQVISMAPEHPAGYFYQAATYWLWLLAAPDKAQGRELLRQLDAATRHTIRVAKQLTHAQPAEAAFYLGAAYGMQARMYAIDKHYFKALGAAKKGGAHLQRCVDLAPTWYDAYYGLGLYHYYLARVPAVLRGVVQLFIGMQGDRTKGLQELEQARSHGVLAASAAASALARIYVLPSEKQYQRAYAILQELTQRYPNNFDYRIRLMYVSALTERWQQARQVSRAVEADVRQGKPYYSRQWLPLLHYRTAETYVLQGEHATALPLLRRLETQEVEADLRAWIVLRLGNVYDLRGEREMARVYYEQVAGDDTARELAAQYLRRPFPHGTTDVKPLDKAM
jgi:tetratricopeptide (TPR) repeat protein